MEQYTCMYTHDTNIFNRVNKYRLKYYLIYGIIIRNRGISWKKQWSEIDLPRILPCFDACQRGFLEFYCWLFRKKRCYGVYVCCFYKFQTELRILVIKMAWFKMCIAKNVKFWIYFIFIFIIPSERMIVLNLIVFERSTFQSRVAISSKI